MSGLRMGPPKMLVGRPDSTPERISGPCLIPVASLSSTCRVIGPFSSLQGSALIMRPDIHLLHYEVCTVYILSYMKRLPQKIEFGPTHRPRNRPTLHCPACKVPYSARTGGKIIISAGNVCHFFQAAFCSS